MLKKLVSLIIIAISIMPVLNAAEKYAILITGDYAGKDIPESMLWQTGNTAKEEYGYDEFWNDTYLMWEMLIDRGYKDENIHVLFADGQDFYIDNEWVDGRYRPTHIYPDQPNLRITDHPATISGFETVVNELSDLTEDDFLFVWTFDHGGYDPVSGRSVLCLLHSVLWDDEFASYMSNIKADKKVYWMQQCSAGGFADDLSAENTYFISATNLEPAVRADDRYKGAPGAVAGLENELIDGVFYHHGEFNFHMYSSTVGKSPDFREIYWGSVLFSDADTNSDQLISVSEAGAWEIGQESVPYSPLEDDIGNIGYHTTLEYPTILLDECDDPDSYLFKDEKGLNGIIGVSENLLIQPVNELKLNNSDTYLLGGRQITLNNNAVFSISNSNFTGMGFDKSLIKNDETDAYIANSIVLKDYSVLNINNSELSSFGIPTTRRAAVNFFQNVNIDNTTLNLRNLAITMDKAFVNIGSDTYLYLNLNSVEGNGNSTMELLPGNTFRSTSTNFSNAALSFKNGEINIFDGISGIESTEFTVSDGSTLEIETASSIMASLCSSVRICSGSTLKMLAGSELNFVGDSHIYFEEGSNLIIEGDARITGKVQIAEGVNVIVSNESVLNLQLASLISLNNSALYLNTGSKLVIENGSNLVIDRNSRIDIDEGAEIVVKNKASLSATGTTFTYTETYGKWFGINCEGGSSVDLDDVYISDAVTGLNGIFNYKFEVTNSVFENCDNGIMITELVDNVSYVVTGNTLTGTKSGTGVWIIDSNGKFRDNSIQYFYVGANFTLCSPEIAKNAIEYNKAYGILISGQNSIPLMINTELNQVYNELNNTVANNGNTNLGTLIFPSSQIGIRPYSNVYMQNGHNNVYSGILNTPPAVPCIAIENKISQVISGIIVNAQNNYWGSYDVTDDFFDGHTQYTIVYDPYSTNPYSSGGSLPSTSQSVQTPENNILTTALKLEDKGNYRAAINLYEQVIRKYEDSPEYYVAMARLPYLYSMLEEDNNVLIAAYDEAYDSENTTNKKFFKGMKVATHIKGKRFDDAIAVAEEMKNEAEFEEEVILADLNIAIANTLKNLNNKGRNEAQTDDIRTLISKLTGSEEKGDETSGVSENALPETSKIYQNYPNPFNPVTQIRFDLANTAKVKLSVYNVNGQKIAELTNGVMNAGAHSVEFDGSKFNSGVYYYTLAAEGRTFTQKMILMK